MRCLRYFAMRFKTEFLIRVILYCYLWRCILLIVLWGWCLSIHKCWDFSTCFDDDRSKITGFDNDNGFEITHEISLVSVYLQGGEAFQEPEVLQSVDGRLDVTLSVKMAQITFEWFTTYRRTYNGSIPGPTWRIRPGDNVTVTLVCYSLCRCTVQRVLRHTCCKQQKNWLQMNGK